MLPLLIRIAFWVLSPGYTLSIASLISLSYLPEDYSLQNFPDIFLDVITSNTNLWRTISFISNGT